MFLTDRKLQRRMDEVKKYRYRGVTPIGEFLMCEDEQKLVNPRVPVNFDGWGRIAGGECWAGRDRYLWMHRDIRIPAEWAGRRAVGIFDFGNTGAGNNSGFESMCYLDEEPSRVLM